MMKHAIKIIPILLLSILFLARVNPCYGQESYVQKAYVQIPTLLNPAFAGINVKGRAAVWYQRQLIGIKNAPTTRLISVETPLLNGRVGVGTNLINDVNGYSGFTGVEMSGAYHIKFDKFYDERSDHYLAFGIGIRANQYAIDKVIQGDGTDPRTNGDLSAGFVDFNFGSFYHQRGFFIGLSFYQLRKENPSLYRNLLEPKARPLVYLQGGFEKEVNGIWIKPIILIRSEQSADLQADIQVGAGLTLSNGGKLWAMPGFRLVTKGFNEGSSGMINLGITLNAFEFGYQWVYPMGGLFKQQTHGITLGYLFQVNGGSGGKPTINNKTGKNFF